jgi:quinol monooxygenase YgiN
MSELTVLTTVPGRPDQLEALRAGLVQLAADIRGEEGCRGFDVYESAAAPGTFVTLARWVDREHFDAHRAAPHVQAAMAQAATLVSAAPEVHPLVPVDG